MFYYFFSETAANDDGITYMKENNEVIYNLDGIPVQVAAKSDRVYRYVWIPSEVSFVRFTSMSTNHDIDTTYPDNKLVGTVASRYPIERYLRNPMVFTSPMEAVQWVRKTDNFVTPFYSGRRMIPNTLLSNYIGSNGVIVNVDVTSFPCDCSMYDYQLILTDDGVVFTLMDSQEQFIPPGPTFGHQNNIVCRSPLEAKKALTEIRSMKLR